MSTLDLRSEEGSPVDKIIFGKVGDHLVPNENNTGVVVNLVDYFDGSFFEIIFEDIPLLIKALQKAQELWGPKE